MSFQLFDDGRPTSEQLEFRFGMRPPELFVKFSQWCYDDVGGDKRAAELLYWRILGLEAYDVDSKGYASPFELFSIGDYDGDQVGWVSLAHERGDSDFPWIQYHHDGDYVSVLAGSTSEFFSRILTYATLEDQDAANDARRAATTLGIALDPRIAKSVGSFGGTKYWEMGIPAPQLQIKVPDGWRYQAGDPIEYGVGVLAPAAQFADEPHIMNPKADPLEAAVVHAERGHFASVLWQLSTPHARHGTPFELYSYWTRYMKAAYLELGRPLMAARVGAWEV